MCPTFAIVSKKKKSKTNNDSIIEKDIEGIIFVDIKANYTVFYNNKHYPIYDKCYSCKGHKKIYIQCSFDGRRIIYIRSDDNLCEIIGYLPFGPGCVVKGDLIRNDSKDVFVIKECWTDKYNKLAVDAFKYYIEHKNEINENIKKKNYVCF